MNVRCYERRGWWVLREPKPVYTPENLFCDCVLALDTRIYIPHIVGDGYWKATVDDIDGKTAMAVGEHILAFLNFDEDGVPEMNSPAQWVCIVANKSILNADW